jgi:hypothetical protein
MHKNIFTLMSRSVSKTDKQYFNCAVNSVAILLWARARASGCLQGPVQSGA